jgi:hypothetical protein
MLHQADLNRLDSQLTDLAFYMDNVQKFEEQTIDW